MKNSTFFTSQFIVKIGQIWDISPWLLCFFIKILKTLRIRDYIWNHARKIEIIFLFLHENYNNFKNIAHWELYRKKCRLFPIFSKSSKSKEKIHGLNLHSDYMWKSRYLLLFFSTYKSLCTEFYHISKKIAIFYNISPRSDEKSVIGSYDFLLLKIQNSYIPLKGKS